MDGHGSGFEVFEHEFDLARVDQVLDLPERRLAKTEALLHRPRRSRDPAYDRKNHEQTWEASALTLDNRFWPPAAVEDF